ncbi:MAG: hypothetical protein WDO70_04155 [Alphaproteobacteria bacterium]
MTISLSNVESALFAEDIEGLLALGAPDDEYFPEAKDITAALTTLSKDRLTEANVIAVISLVWAKYFELSNDDIEKRIPAFRRIAQNLL